MNKEHTLWSSFRAPGGATVAMLMATDVRTNQVYRKATLHLVGDI